MSVPKLRFKEFDGDWSESKLKDCIDSIDSGWSPQCESYPADENEWAVLKTTSVDWDGFKANFNKKLPSSLEARFEIEVKPSDILVTRAGPTERVGVVAVVPQNVRSKLMISDKLIRLKANSDNSPEFLGISLSSVKCQNQLQSKTSGLAKSQTNISQKILSDVSLMTPAKPEQTKIASFLSAVDEKISQLTRKHELLSQYKQGMMQKLFSQQIRFKADDGSEFGEWEQTLLSEFLTESLIKGLKGNEAKKLTVKLWGKGVVPKNEVFEGSENTQYYKRFVGQLIYGKLDFLNCAFGIIPTHLDGYETTIDAPSFDINKEKANPYFLLNRFLQKDFYKKNGEEADGSRKAKRINQSVFLAMQIDLPCSAEQTKIANFLSAIDQKIEVVAQEIEQAKQWKKGLLQQMFV